MLNERTTRTGVEIPEALKKEDKKATGKKKTDVKTAAERGQAIIATMPEERVNAMGSKSTTLTFKHLLGLQSKKASRAVGIKEDGTGNITQACSLHVGGVFVSSEPIEIPQLDASKDYEKGFTAEDVTMKKVKAGEEFALTMTEIMLLLTREEYAGVCNRNEHEKAISFAPKMAKFDSQEQALPTPTLRAKVSTGSVKADMVDIDTIELGDGKFDIVDEYKEKFGYFLKNHTAQRGTRKSSAGSKNTTDRDVSVAIQDILNRTVYGQKG